MRKYMLTTSIYLFFCIIYCNAQSKTGNNWITGYSGNRVDFKSVGINTNQGLSPFKYFTGGNSCISDTNGSLLFYSNGFDLFNKLGVFIENGDTLVPIDYYMNQSGSSFGSQTSIILPMDSHLYYFITPTFSNNRFDDCYNNGGNCYFDLLLYNVIDMNANIGLGKVVKSMESLMQNADLRKTQMMACRHGNGKDWWLLKNEGDSANVHTFLFTQDSVYDKGVQAFSEPVWGAWDIRGQSTFNNEGTQYATTSHGSSTGLIFIADFDRCHGLLSKPYVIKMPWGSMHDPIDTGKKERLSVGLAFSPNGKFLYVASRRNLYQYDLSDSSWYHVVGLDTTYIEFQDYETAYLGPDNKIYIGNWAGLSKQISRIDNPDVKGVGCNFCPRCLRLDSLGANAYVGTPPCMPNYSLGAMACWPLDTGNTIKENELFIYPNPASSILIIKNRKGIQKQLFNSIGQLILSTLKDEMKVTSYPSGVYYVRCDGQVKKIIIECK